VPGSSVAVTITSPSSNQIRTVPNRVLFTPLNWNVPQAGTRGGRTARREGVCNSKQLHA
jgi:hypothetical protein